jgi:hypothetical protein
MSSITKKQLAKLHVLLHQLGMADQKADMVFNISGGRTKSSRELTLLEAKELLEYLSKYDPSERMRKKVLALAYESGIIYGDTPEDKKMNVAKIDMFLQSKGVIKKRLNDLKHDELIKVVNQFEQIVKHISYSQAGKQTKNLLNELNIKSL